MGDHGDAPAVIALVRRRRPGALQTRQQERFVDVFACYVRHLRCAPSGRSCSLSSCISALHEACTRVQTCLRGSMWRVRNCCLRRQSSGPAAA